jgi:hypothetical protein
VISTHTVIVLLLIEALLLVVGLGLLLGHGLWDAWRARRIAPRMADARRARSLALEAGGPDMLCAALRVRLPAAQQIVLLGELAPNLIGSHRRLLTRAAGEVGLLARADALCRSRLWRRRLRGARMFALLGGGARVVPRLLDDSRAEVRAQAAEWASGHPDQPRTIVRLVRMLGDDHTLCRFTVEDSLVRLGHAAVPALALYLRAAQGDPARRALRVATMIADARLLEVGMLRCRDPDGEVRAAAAGLLGALGGDRAAEMLESLVDDPEAGVRAVAAATLGRLRRWAAAPRLAALLGDPSWDVRRAAGQSLRELGGVGTLLLQRTLADPDRFARDMARHVLDLPQSAVRAAA